MNNSPKMCVCGAEGFVDLGEQETFCRYPCKKHYQVIREAIVAMIQLGADMLQRNDILRGVFKKLGVGNG